jgi:hypothetical protein
MKKGTIALLGIGIVVLVAVVFWLVPMSMRNNVANQENNVIEKMQNCGNIMTQGTKAIIESAIVDKDTKEAFIKAIDSATPEQSSQIQKGYAEAVNTGNQMPLMLMLNSMVGGTDMTATAVMTQTEISSQRQQMALCSTQLNRAQRELKSALGMDASGAIVKYPQVWVFDEYTLSDIFDGNLVDNDGDGRYTVLDYRSPVDADISASFGTGEAVESDLSCVILNM